MGGGDLGALSAPFVHAGRGSHVSGMGRAHRRDQAVGVEVLLDDTRKVLGVQQGDGDSVLGD